MTKLEQFMTKALDIGLEMRRVGTKYGWGTPVTLENALKKSTCVTYANVVLQEAGYLPKGLYVHYTNGKLAGNGLSYIKKHPETFEILHVKASPQKLGDRLKRGDVCFYAVPHMQIYSGKTEKGTPKWYSLERGPGGIGAKAKLTLSGTFSFYSKRKIEYIIRLKFSDSETKPQIPTNASGAIKQTKYKLKIGMNIRASASASSKKVGYAPQGAIITQTAKQGTWVKTTYCGVVGWINCSTTYASKI